MKRRRGWTPKDHDHNQRFHDLVNAGWDIIIIDEAHNSPAQPVRSHASKLGRALNTLTPLSATPHQGKTDAFLR